MSNKYLEEEYLRDMYAEQHFKKSGVEEEWEDDEDQEDSER